MTNDEVRMIKAHLESLIKAQGPQVKVPVKAGTLLALVDLVLARFDSKGR